MEAALYTLVREHRSLELSIGNITRLKTALKDFYTAMTSASTAEIGYLLDVHYEALAKVKQYIKSNHMGDATIKRLHDQIFVDKLALSKSSTGAPVTRLFEEFIKGITYFQHQNDPTNPVPIYHRLYSCGPGNQIYRDDNLICSKKLSTTEKRRRELIDRCYLERLIYDALWRHETLNFPEDSPSTSTGGHTQNRGHMFRMDLTRTDYETCFPGISIDVSVGYEGRFPISLKIVRKKKGQIIYTEEYRQELKSLDRTFAPYTGFVTGKRTLANGKVYAKTNDFLMEGDWKLVRV